MRKLIIALGCASCVILILILIGAGMIDRFYSKEVLIISPKPQDVVELERMMWMPGDPVADIYGIPTDHPVKVVMPDSTRIIRPEEDPSLVLLAVDKQQGDNPLQVQTVWFITTRLAIGLGLMSLLGLIVWRFPRRKRP